MNGPYSNLVIYNRLLILSYSFSKQPLYLHPQTDLEKICEIFTTTSSLIQRQHTTLDNIEHNIESTKVTTEETIQTIADVSNRSQMILLITEIRCNGRSSMH